MTPDELNTIGQLLFGVGWQSKLARSLKRPDGGHVNPRTVRRWVAGETPIPAGVDEALRARLKQKRKKKGTTL